jgi:hypothetical protein
VFGCLSTEDVCFVPLVANPFRLQVSRDLGLGGCECRPALSPFAVLGDDVFALLATIRDRRFVADDGDDGFSGASGLLVDEDGDGLAHRALTLTDVVGCM